MVPVPSARACQHQTGVRPRAESTLFRAEMTDLWAAVASGHPGLGMPAFFPVVAYEQVKAVGDPAADWQNRLVAEYRADIKAAHGLLGGHGQQAKLVRVIVPEAASNWILPGVCDNNIGYWHVSGARLVYRVRGQTRSFGISTLISWRGRWYVVHLGGELRAGPAVWSTSPPWAPARRARPGAASPPPLALSC